MNACDFLDAEAKRPFEWGETDCATTADRWFRHVHGFSPMQRYGRLVMNQELGRAWLEQPGGLVRGIRDVMRQAGVRTRDGCAASGDVGVILVDDRACIAIYDGTLWRSRDIDGLIAADDTHRYIAWEVDRCPRH